MAIDLEELKHVSKSHFLPIFYYADRWWQININHTLY